jgi:hypothetical protein
LWLDAASFKGHIAAVTEDEVEPADTDHEKEHQEPRVRWGVIASVLVHVPIVALLIFGLPKIQPKPAEDESVKVELVPPPEEKKPEEKKPEEKPKEEEKPQEQAKAEPPLPPPPPPPSPTPPSSETRAGGSSPVFEFGDKNTGPMKSMNGNASEGEKKDTPVPPSSSPPQPPEEQTADATITPQPLEQPAGNPVPKEIELPQIASADTHSERDAPAAATTEEVKTSFEPEKHSVPKPAPQKDQLPKAPLPEVKTLFSQNMTDDQIARTAMGNMSRGERMNQLCRSELNQQIIHENPRFRDAELPSYSLTNETVIETRKGAFLKSGKWYNVQFRCEVDADAKRILSFAFKFGGPLPESQYPTYNSRR